MQIKEFVDTTMKVISYIIDYDYSDGKAYIFKDEYGFIRRKNEFNICRLGIYNGGLVINETPRFYGSTLFDIEKTSNPETETISITPAYIIKLLFEKYKDQNLIDSYLNEHLEINEEDDIFEMDTIDKIIYANNLTDKKLEKYNIEYSKLYELLCKLKEQNLKGEKLDASEIAKELDKIKPITNSVLSYDIKSIEALTTEELANINLVSPLIAKKIEIMAEFEKTLYEAYEKGFRFALKEMYCEDLINKKELEQMKNQSQDMRYSFGWFATLVNLGVNDILYNQDKTYYQKSDRGKITRLGLDKKTVPGNAIQYVKNLSLIKNKNFSEAKK